MRAVAALQLREAAAIPRRPRGKHVRLEDYESPKEQGAAEWNEEVVPLSESLVADAGRKIDCPDCGRTLEHRGRCSKCGSDSWRPAGHINRRLIRRFLSLGLDLK